MARILRTQEAEVDLLEAWVFVAHDSEAAADRLIAAIESKCRALAVAPRLGRHPGRWSERHGPFLRYLRLVADPSLVEDGRRTAVPVIQASWLVRRLVFAGLTVSMVGVYCYAMGRALPPLRKEPVTSLLLPMMVISGVVSLLIHPLLCRQRQRSSQVFTLYVGFLLSTVIYGVYLWALIPDGTVGMIRLALVFGHMYGFPLFLAVFLTHQLLGRVLYPPLTGDSR